MTTQLTVRTAPVKVESYIRSWSRSTMTLLYYVEHNDCLISLETSLLHDHHYLYTFWLLVSNASQVHLLVFHWLSFLTCKHRSLYPSDLLFSSTCIRHRYKKMCNSVWSCCQKLTSTRLSFSRNFNFMNLLLMMSSKKDTRRENYNPSSWMRKRSAMHEVEWRGAAFHDAVTSSHHHNSHISGKFNLGVCEYNGQKDFNISLQIRGGNKTFKAGRRSIRRIRLEWSHTRRIHTYIIYIAATGIHATLACRSWPAAPAAVLFTWHPNAIFLDLV